MSLFILSHSKTKIVISPTIPVSITLRVPTFLVPISARAKHSVLFYAPGPLHAHPHSHAHAHAPSKSNYNNNNAIEPGSVLDKIDALLNRPTIRYHFQNCAMAIEEAKKNGVLPLLSSQSQSPVEKVRVGHRHRHRQRQHYRNECHDEYENHSPFIDSKLLGSPNSHRLENGAGTGTDTDTDEEPFIPIPIPVPTKRKRGRPRKSEAEKRKTSITNKTKTKKNKNKSANTNNTNSKSKKKNSAAARPRGRPPTKANAKIYAQAKASSTKVDPKADLATLKAHIKPIPISLSISPILQCSSSSSSSTSTSKNLNNNGNGNSMSNGNSNSSMSNGIIDLEQDVHNTATIDVLIMAQMIQCGYIESDDVMSYLRQKPLPEGFPGVQCKHCCQCQGQNHHQNQNQIHTDANTSNTKKKWFFNSYKQMATGLPKMEQHLLFQCEACPQSIKDHIIQAKRQEDLERTVLRMERALVVQQAVAHTGIGIGGTQKHEHERSDAGSGSSGSHSNGARVTRRAFARILFDRLVGEDYQY